MNKEFYVRQAMIKRAFQNKNIKEKSGTISKIIPDSVKESLLVKWAKIFAKKTGLDSLFGSGIYIFMTQAWETFEKKDDGTINLDYGALLDFLEEEGFREPKTEFGKKFAPKLQKLTEVSDLAQFIIKVLVCDGTKELREVTGIPFTKLTKEDLDKGKGIDISSKIPFVETGKFLLEGLANMDERKLALITYMIPLLLKLISLKITLPMYLAYFATDLTIREEIARFFLTMFFGSSAKRSSVLKKIYILIGGGFFALINDLYSLIGWTTEKIVYSIYNSLSKYGQWIILALTEGISAANQNLRLKNEEEDILERELAKRNLLESIKKQETFKKEIKRQKINQLRKEKKKLERQLNKVEEQLNPAL